MKSEAIEYVEPPKRKHSGESYGGIITVYRLKLMTAEEIARYGLEKYMPEEGESNAE